MSVRHLMIGLLVILVAACGDWGQGADDGDVVPPDETISFRKDGELRFMRTGIDSLVIDVEIAETDSARERGLMQRTSLPELSGMLFIFPREEIRSFWMANTPLALDLMFVDADSQIVDIEKYTTPFSSTSIVSDEPARYVIEVPAGFADTYGIVEGQAVSWTRGAE